MIARSDRPWTSLHLCGGMGGGGLGWLLAGAPGKSVDVSASACRNYEKLTGQEAVCEDITTMTPGDLRDVHGPEAPDMVVTSAPCKGLSRCMGAEKAQTEKYLRLNNVALYTVQLALEAWEIPPPLFYFEQVPGILEAKNRPLLDRIVGTLHAYRYSVDVRVHDCGEIGGLAQRRKRVLIVARHMDQVPNFMRLPQTHRVRGIGEVLGLLPLPLPGSSAGGPMHRLPELSEENWARLAAIRAGKDWRDLPPELRLKPRAARQNGGRGVNDWNQPSHTVMANATVSSTWSAVADPRLATKRRDGGMGVQDWNRPSACIIANPIIHNWPLTVADPREVEPTHVALEGMRDGHRIVEIEGPPFNLHGRSKCHMVIQAPDGTWHRPMTTLELAALQGFPVRNEKTGEWLVLDGKSHSQWREHIGDAIPVPTAEAIAREGIATLAAARDGWKLMGPGGQIWVSPERLAA